MRPIIFRAWNRNKKEMNSNPFLYECFLNDVFKEKEGMNGYVGTDYMQFTGLLDKNGKEIHFVYGNLPEYKGSWKTIQQIGLIPKDAAKAGLALTNDKCSGQNGVSDSLYDEYSRLKEHFLKISLQSEINLQL